MAQEAIIKDIYHEFDKLILPLAEKIRVFSAESKALIEAQLAGYLRANKFIIDETEKEIKKSETKDIKGNPNLMLEQTINEAEIVNRRENLLIENGESYKWYSDTTKQMIKSVVIEIKSMMKVIIRLINNSF